MINTNIIVPPSEHMIKRGTTPKYIKETIEDIKEILLNDPYIYPLLFKNNLTEDINNKKENKTNPLEIRYHGSYARHTDTFHFNKLEKSDIDIYIKVGNYMSSPSIFKNRHGSDKNFNNFDKQWTSGISNNFYISKDKDDKSYRPIKHFTNFKSDLFKYLKFKLKDCDVTNNNKVIKISKGSLNIELAICGDFNLELNNNVKGFNWFKEIKNYYNNKKLTLNNCIELKEHFIKVKGMNLITSENKEIQNFPEINNINITIKNRKTDGWFSKYVRYLKNLIKIINKDDENIIPLKSYHLECLLYYVNDSYFIPWKSKEELKNNLIKCLSSIFVNNEKDFNLLNEINGLLRLNRSLTYNNYKTAILNLFILIKDKLNLVI